MSVGAAFSGGGSFIELKLLEISKLFSGTNHNWDISNITSREQFTSGTWSNPFQTIIQVPIFKMKNALLWKYRKIKTQIKTAGQVAEVHKIAPIEQIGGSIKHLVILRDSYKSRPCNRKLILQKFLRSRMLRQTAGRWNRLFLVIRIHKYTKSNSFLLQF